MSSFTPSYLNRITLHPATAWGLNICAEARGLQELWSISRPELIEKLRESALIHSAESSNRIEGVEIDKKRLKPLILGNSKPKDRPEEEVYGYRKALNLIHTKKLPVSPETIKKLHKIAQGGLISDAGKWKIKDNEIVEFTTQGDRKIRFKCTPAKSTPQAIKKLCEDYNKNIQEQKIPELLLIANFILDFLCIHPFRDGNGRFSRLLTLLCLQQMNYQVGRYISLEKIIEESKIDYYEALKKSSAHWHEEQHDLFPWWSFFLYVLRTAYQQLKDRVENAPKNTGSKTSLIQQFVLEQDDEFKISDILNFFPSLDREIVKKTLLKLHQNKIIRQIGSGRSSRWKKL